MPDLQLAPSFPHVYNNMSETRGRSELCRPYARNEKGIAALLQPATGFHITRNQHRPLNGSGVRAWIDGLQEKQAARIIFCVPSKLYSTFKKQDAVNLNLQRYPFQQYVMKIDLCVPESA